MLRGYFTNRWIIGGFLFLLLFAVFCHFWFQNETAKLQKQEAENAEIRQRSEVSKKEQETGKHKPTGTMPDRAPIEKRITVTEKTVGVTDTALVNTKTDDMERVTPEIPNAENTEEMRVSRFGFGPYPKTPEGWSPIPWELYTDPDRELMTRVRIKFLEQGEPIKGVTMDNGRVYPIITGICYVKWKTETTPEGEVRRITRTLCTIKDGDRLDAIEEANGGVLTVSDIPSDIKLISYEEGGVDPYEFLNLKE